MKDLTQKFLTEKDHERIRAAVKSAEALTSGEIVPLVVSASYHYPMADVVGGALLSFLAALVFTPVIGGFFWVGPRNMWIFIGLFVICFVPFYSIVKRIGWFKRLFISKAEMEAEVEEAAVTHFFREGLYRTRDETGILIFISIFERKVWVLADRGINDRVPESQWNDIVEKIVLGIKKGHQADAICEAVADVGRILKEHFPVKPDDIDELENLIVK